MVCRNKVMKLCSICEINQVKAYCYESSAHCDKECTTVLACGHSVRWKCGNGADPRLSTEFRCLGCILSPWEEALIQELPQPPQCVDFLKDMRSKFLTGRDGTVMGMGSRLMDLVDASILERLDDEDGMIKICVGAAFAFNKYPSDTPFRVVNDKSANKKSNELAVKLMAKGFDYVSLHPDKCNKKGISEHVYWHPDAVIPLSIFCLKVKSICCVCGDSTKRNDGYMCSQSHFLCWSCFREYASKAADEDAIARGVDAQGNLRCPECVESYDLYRIASKVPPSVLETITNLKLKVISNSKG